MHSFSAAISTRPFNDFGAAIKLDPRNVQYYLSLGDLWIRKEEFDESIADFTAAIKLSPKNAGAYASRARAWAGKHEREKEVADLTEAIRLDPANVWYRTARGNSWSAQGFHARAIADYNDALRLDPNNPMIYVLRGIEWRKHASVSLKEPDQAVADFTRAIEIDPTYEFAYIQRAQIWMRRENFDRILGEYSELLAHNPESALGHESLARLLATCKNRKYRDGNRAVAEATRACELTHWRDPDCADTLAAAYAEVGTFSDAVKWQERAIELLPKTPLSGFDRRLAFDGRLALYKSRKSCRE